MSYNAPYVVVSITPSYVIFEDLPDSVVSCMSEENRDVTTLLLYNTYGDVSLLYYSKDNVLTKILHQNGHYTGVAGYSTEENIW